MRSFLLTAFCYLAIISITIALSSTTSEQSLYDQFIINLDGAVIPYSDYTKITDFYSEVLDFSPIFSKTIITTPVVGFRISKTQRLYLLPKSSQGQSSTTVAVVRVRSGFQQLHQALELRISDYVGRSTTDTSFSDVYTVSISEIVTKPWGKEFSVSDPDGNTLIFLRGKTRGRARG